jgi:hypothetical protein
MKLSPSQQIKLANIKRRTLANEPVSSEERQWVLTVFRVSQKALPKEVVVLAQQRGYDISGIRVA